RPFASKKLSRSSRQPGKSGGARKGKTPAEPPKTGTKPIRLPLITWEGKTRIEHFPGARFLRLGEVRGKTLAWIELYSGGREGHSITLRFSDRTELLLELVSGLTMLPEFFSAGYRSLRKWRPIRSGDR